MQQVLMHLSEMNRLHNNHFWASWNKILLASLPSSSLPPLKNLGGQAVVKSSASAGEILMSIHEYAFDLSYANAFKS